MTESDDDERDWDCTHMTPRQHSTTHHTHKPHLWGRKWSYREGLMGPQQDDDKGQVGSKHPHYNSTDRMGMGMGTGTTGMRTKTGMAMTMMMGTGWGPPPPQG